MRWNHFSDSQMFFWGWSSVWISLNLESEPTLPVRGGSQDAARDHCTIACEPRVHLLTSSGRLDPEVTPSSISFKKIEATKLPKGGFQFFTFGDLPWNFCEKKRIRIFGQLKGWPCEEVMVPFVNGRPALIQYRPAFPKSVFFGGRLLVGFVAVLGVSCGPVCLQSRKYLVPKVQIQIARQECVIVIMSCDLSWICAQSEEWTLPVMIKCHY